MQTQRFFSMLYPLSSGWVELRPFREKKPVSNNRSWLPVRNKSRITNRCLALRRRYDLFYGVATRSKESKNRKVATKQYLKALTCLFADMDAKDFQGMEAIYEKISDFPLTPSAVVHSGHGLHIYYFLEQPVNLNTKKAINEMESLIKALVKALPADRTSGVSQILRVPNSINWKDPYHPRPVEVKKLENRRYSLGRLREVLDWQKKAVTLSPGPEIDLSPPAKEINIEGLKITARMKELIKTGWRDEFRDHYPSRSECDQAVITALLSADYSPSIIKYIFEHYPIGEKYREKGKHRDRYLKHSIKRAKKYLKVSNS